MISIWNAADKHLFWERRCRINSQRGTETEPLEGPMEGTGDTKTKWYFLFSPYCGIVNTDTNASPRKPNTALEGASTALAIPKGGATALIVDRQCPHQFSPKNPNTQLQLRDATKGKDDTKTEWYYLFSTHFWDRQCPHQPVTKKPKHSVRGC